MFINLPPGKRRIRGEDKRRTCKEKSVLVCQRFLSVNEFESLFLQQTCVEVELYMDHESGQRLMLFHGWTRIPIREPKYKVMSDFGEQLWLSSLKFAWRKRTHAESYGINNRARLTSHLRVAKIYKLVN